MIYNFLSYSTAEPQPITDETAKDAFKINQPNPTTKQQGNEEGGTEGAQNEENASGGPFLRAKFAQVVLASFILKNII